MICRERLLVDDAYPWNEVPNDRATAVAEAFGPLGVSVLDSAALTERLMPVLEPIVRPGDLVVLPLMSGGLLAEGVERLTSARGAHVLFLHMSKHPFVTLAGDTQEEYNASLLRYEAGAVTMEGRVVRALRNAPRTKGRIRIIFVDSNSARGRDALLVRRWLQARTQVPLEFNFVVAINETTDDVAHAPGWRAGRKDLQPDAWAVRLIGSTTSYLSHLRFLARPEEEQFANARSTRARYPGLTHFWDALPPELAAIHGHRESKLSIHTERTHARLAREDAGRIDRIEAALSVLDSRAPTRSTPDSLARRHRLLSLEV